jgi:hypothetical protein
MMELSNEESYDFARRRRRTLPLKKVFGYFGTPPKKKLTCLWDLDILGFMMKLSNEESYDEMKIMNFHDETFK